MINRCCMLSIVDVREIVIRMWWLRLCESKFVYQHVISSRVRTQKAHFDKPQHACSYEGNLRVYKQRECFLVYSLCVLRPLSDQNAEVNGYPILTFYFGMMSFGKYPAAI